MKKTKLELYVKVSDLNWWAVDAQITHYSNWRMSQIITVCLAQGMSGGGKIHGIQGNYVEKNDCKWNCVVLQRIVFFFLS